MKKAFWLSLLVVVLNGESFFLPDKIKIEKQTLDPEFTTQEYIIKDEDNNKLLDIGIDIIKLPEEDKKENSIIHDSFFDNIPEQP